MTALRPCPCCGWENILTECYGVPRYKVICPRCHIQTRIDTLDKVTETWNRRVSE